MCYLIQIIFLIGLRVKTNLSSFQGSLQKMCPWRFPKVWNKCIIKASIGTLLAKHPSDTL